MIIENPINPPTTPNEARDREAAGEAERHFVYVLSEDKTHYVFRGEITDKIDDYAAISIEQHERLAAENWASRNIAIAYWVEWYPGEKADANGLPFPHDPENPPYESPWELVRDENGDTFEEWIDLE